jgi:hypothetical protein
MTDHTSHQGRDWETTVQQIAHDFPYPPTPDLAHTSADWLPAPDHRRRIALRPAWAVLIVLILLVALLAVPQVRASLIEALRIGAVQINLIDDDTLPYAPLIVFGVPGQTLQGETTLAAAQEAVQFPIHYPLGLGEPDRVFVQQLDWSLVILVWNDPADPSRAAIALHILGPDAFAIKSVPRLITETTVNGSFAVWATGPYTVVYKSGEIALGYLVEGNVLLWQVDRQTYRLESSLSLDDARQLAASIE